MDAVKSESKPLETLSCVALCRKVIGLLEELRRTDYDLRRETTTHGFIVSNAVLLGYASAKKKAKPILINYVLHLERLVAKFPIKD